MLKRYYTYIFTFVCIYGFYANKAVSQENTYYPNFFSNTQFHGNQFGPTYIPNEGKAEFSVGYKSLVGAFHNVANYYFSAAKVFRNEDQTAHLARINFTNDKDGPYIASPRILANYAYKIRINSNAFLTAGLSFGVAGITFAAPSSTQSDVYVPDGSIGLSFKWKKLTIGGSSMQILNSSTRQGPNPVIFHRYYQAFGSIEKEWYTGWTLTGNGLFRYLPFQYNQAWAGLSLDYRRQFLIGANIAYAGTLSVFGGWTAFVGEDRMTISFGYNSNVFNVLPTWQNNIELGLNYLIR